MPYVNITVPLTADDYEMLSDMAVIKATSRAQLAREAVALYLHGDNYVATPRETPVKAETDTSNITSPEAYTLRYEDLSE